ncbi:MAG: bifunctional shikimate kinase/3-dehydroquinate synthase [Thermaerobacter sp.]|nr:bifunctional shikimate kinase/3-dehydroquinate synthase [Thermaerobacter sp.]
MIVALVGLPGAGKTRIGRELAERLQFEFLDTDHLLQSRYGKPVGELLISMGTSRFRDEESRVLAEALSGDRRIVSTGGGTILRQENRDRLREVRVIGLTARDGQLLGRLRGGKGRPVLEPDPAERLRALRWERGPLYEEVAEAWFWTESAPSRAVDRIYSFLQLDRLGPGVYFGRGARRHAGAFSGFGKSMLLMQPTVREAWGESLLAQLHYGGRQTADVVVPDGDAAKELPIYENLLSRAAQFGMGRDEPVLALGGGAVCDLAGYVAATYLRGVPLVLVPTTVLAQADAALGGKTGLNLAEGKNLVGAFYPARATLIDPETLRTLPHAAFRDGLSEVVKCGVGLDAELFAAAERWPRLPAGPHLDFAISRAAGTKLRIVASDPFEKSGERAKLNLGHTIAHAVEAQSGFTVTHGRAVAIGLSAVARYAAARHGFRDAARVIATLRRLGLPTSWSGDPQSLLPFIGRDKKRQAGRLRLVVPTRIGSCELVEVGSEDALLLAQMVREN